MRPAVRSPRWVNRTRSKASFTSATSQSEALRTPRRSIVAASAGAGPAPSSWKSSGFISRSVLSKRGRPTLYLDSSSERVSSAAGNHVAKRSFSSRPTDSNPLKATKDRIRQDHNYCVDLVRDRDREGYLSGLLMPSNTQHAYFALQAFNVELASIKDGSVRIRTAGADNSSLAVQLKFQRWKDILEEIYDDNNNNNNGGDDDDEDGAFSSEFAPDPVASSLARAVHDKNLTRRFLERLIEAREADVEVVQLNTVQEVTRYAEESVSSRLYLTLECCGVRDDEADIVASHAGVGIGVLTNLRAAPVRLATGEVPIPVELLPPSFPYGVLQDLAHDPETRWPDPQDEHDWRDAINQMAMVASGHLMKAQHLQGKIPKAGRPVLLPMIPHLHYLSKLESPSVNYDVFHPGLYGDKWDRLKVMMLLSRSWLTGVY